MTRSKAAFVLLGTLALGVATAGLALGRSPRALPKAALPRAPLTCRLAVGEELAFSVESTTDGRKPGAAAPTHVELESTMWWRVLEERAADGWVVGVVLSEVHIERGAAAEDPARTAGSSALEAPFLVRVGRDCSFREFAFDPTTQAEARRQQEGLVRATEVILAPVPAAQWVSRHHDALGAFDSTYAVDSTRDVTRDDGGIVINRKRTRYASGLPELPAMGGRLRVEVLQSEGRAVLDPEGRWLAEFSGNEGLRISVGDRHVSDLDSSVHLERLAGGQAPRALAALDQDRFAWGASAAASAKRTSAEAPPLDPALGALNTDGALEDFTRALGRGPGSLHDATGRLAAYLAANPKAIDDLLTRLRRGDLDKSLHAPLFLALEKTGTPAAERALAGALGDHRLNPENRLRAAAALEDIPRPTERTAQTLIDQARAARGGAEEKSVATASLLALGALSGRADSIPPEVSRLAKAELGEQLRTARAPEDVAVTLDAIGNAGDKAFAASIQRYTEDPSEAVRAHAAQAYRSMDRATMEPVLVAWLGQEPEPVVRRAIAESLGEKLHGDAVDAPHASPAVVAAAAARLAVEPDAQVRGALIVLLGTAAAVDPAAKLALIQQFHRETVVDLQVLIGRFVSADDLR